MPCYDSRSDPDYVREDARREFRHNSDVAELLCFVLSHPMSVVQACLNNNPALAKWWAEHAERDRKKAVDERQASKNGVVSARRNLEEARAALDKALKKRK